MTSSINATVTGPQRVISARDPHDPPPYGRHRVTARTLPQHRAKELVARRRGTLLRRAVGA